MEEVALEPCALPGMGWVVLGVSTMRAPLVGPRWVSCDLRVLGNIQAGVGALAAASHLWQIQGYILLSLEVRNCSLPILGQSPLTSPPEYEWSLSPQASSMWMGSPRA